MAKNSAQIEEQIKHLRTELRAARRAEAMAERERLRSVSHELGEYLADAAGADSVEAVQRLQAHLRQQVGAVPVDSDEHRESGEGGGQYDHA